MHVVHGAVIQNHRGAAVDTGEVVLVPLCGGEQGLAAGQVAATDPAPLLQLAQVPPLRVMRRDVGELKATTLSVWALGLTGFAVLLIAVSRDLKLGLMVVGGFAGAVLLYAGMAWLAVYVLRRTVVEGSAPPWLMLATRQISARPVYAMVQVSALAVGLLALALLVLLRTDLISSWRNATPPDAPNRFVINVQPDQGEAFQQALRQAGVAAQEQARDDAIGGFLGVDFQPRHLPSAQDALPARQEVCCCGVAQDSAIHAAAIQYA